MLHGGIITCQLFHGLISYFKVKLKYSKFNYATCLYDFFTDSLGVLL